MPRFFFHVRDDIDTEDFEGLELPDLEAARQGAIQSARSIMCETLLNGRIALSHRIEITDGKGNKLDTICFADAVSVED